MPNAAGDIPKVSNMSSAIKKKEQQRERKRPAHKTHSCSDDSHTAVEGE